MIKFVAGSLLAGGFAVGLTGCHHPSVTAVSLAPHVCDDRCTHTHFFGTHHHEAEGIPFYLPKPLLIVSKNFRNIEEPKVGLTDSAPIPNAFDDQGKYADLNARASFNFAGGDTPTPPPDSTKPVTQSGDPTVAKNPAEDNVPPASTASKSGAYTYSQNSPNVTPHDLPSDGLAPNTFYTYQIIFVPDMTQKYGLKVKGGVGEIRAAMNLVNGWQFTGLGPYYMKDSSTAQDVMASGIAARLGGQAVQDVLKGVAGLTSGGKLQSDLPASAPQVQSLAKTIGQLRQETHPLMTIPNYAEIYVYEARLGPDGQMMWTEIFSKPFDRAYLGMASVTATTGPGDPAPSVQGVAPPIVGGGAPTSPSPTASGAARAIDPNMARILGHVLGAPMNGAGTPAPTSALESALPQAPTVPGASAAASTAPTAAGAPGTRPAPLGLGLFHHNKKTRGLAQTRTLNMLDNLGSVMAGGGADPNAAPVSTQPIPPTTRPPSASPAGTVTLPVVGASGPPVPPAPPVPPTIGVPAPAAPLTPPGGGNAVGGSGLPIPTNPSPFAPPT